MLIPQRAAPYMRRPEIGRSETYMGCLFTWLATAEDTEGQFSFLEALCPRGVEPPPHIHTLDDEAYYIIEGELDFTVGGQPIKGMAGSFIWLPRGVEHGFVMRSEQAKLLILISPAGQEQAFKKLSTPATTLAFTRPSGPPPPEVIEAIIADHSAIGVQFTGPPPPPPELR